MSESGLRARVGKQTALYGIGLVLGKSLSFLSLPIYTQLLTPADYGVIQLIEMTFDMLTILAGSRLGVGIFRFYHKANATADKRAVLTTALTLVFCTFSVIAIGAWFSAASLSRMIFGSESYAPVIRVAALSFPWDGVIAIPLGFLRLRDRAGSFVLVGLVKSVLQLAGVYILLAHFDMGIRGVFVSTLIANVLVGSVLLTLMLRETGLRFSRGAAGDLIRFGMPLVVTQVATFFTTFGDRYFLQSSTGETEVGIYALAYTFGFLLFTLGFTPFGSVWDPVRFEVAHREDRDRLFSRAFILMNLLLVTVAVGLALFSPDLLRVMSDPAFWAAAPLIPVILLAYLLQGWAAFHDIGILVREQTRFVTVANWAAAFAAALGYIFLIPRFGAWGAAWATVVAFALRAVLIYRFSQRLWPLRYEWAPVQRLLAIALVTFGVHWFLPTMGWVASVSIRIGLVVVYAMAVWMFDIVPSEERDLLIRWLRDPTAAVREIAGGLKPRPSNR